MFSVWVEGMAVRLRQLEGKFVPRSQDAWTGLLGWMAVADNKEQSEADGYAFSLNAARQARAADRLLRHWREGGEDSWLDEDFYRARQNICAAMDAEGVYSPEDWLVDLTRALGGEAKLPLDLPVEIDLRGFVEITPLEQALLEALAQRGVRVRSPEPGFDVSSAEVLGFETPEDEWQAAARWAKSKLDSGASSVCVVLPSEATASGPHARRVRETFAAAFHPRETASLDDSGLRDFYIPSAGRLIHEPAIRTASMLLRLSIAGPDAKHDFPWISQWLLAPHWVGADSERLARAILEIRLRERGLFRLSLNDTVRLARAAGLDQGLTEVFARIEALASLTEGEEAADRFYALLGHWGWPGPNGDSVATACREFCALLERLAGLELRSGEPALGLLEQMCLESTRSFGGGPLSAVQVVAPEVAVGGRYDGIWVCHMDDTNWPPPIAPNPYLPGEMRRRIPRMNPEGQFEHYQVLTHLLCAAAPEVRLSWSRDAGRGPRGVSGLLENLAGQSQEARSPLRLSTALWPEAGIDSRIKSGLTAIEDAVGIPFPDSDSIELPGGSDFFRLQAACPLWAYMRHRLGAAFPVMPVAMADPAFRGVLLHRALRALYELRDPADSLPRREHIHAAVRSTLSEPRVRERLTATGLLAETGRLERALSDWLALDGTREAFAVESLEAAYTMSLGRAAIRIRIDRIDRLADDRLFLIDYKSSKGGRSQVLKWLGKRMQEPQLPLYAVLLEANGEGETGGIAIAAVKPGKCGYDGISDDGASQASGIRVVGKGSGEMRSLDWSAVIAGWREQVETLRDGILEGRAENSVYDIDALRFCDLSLILRHEDTGWLFDEEGDQDVV